MLTYQTESVSCIHFCTFVRPSNYMSINPYILIFSIVLFSKTVFCQKDFQRNPETGEICITGFRAVNVTSQKKIMNQLLAWSSVRLDDPSMVFSIINSSADSLVLKGMTEVPSSKSIHPITFRLVLLPGKKTFSFRADKFYFEDINLSLQQWLEKYGTTENSRSKRNVELIVQGVNSHIFLAMNNLAKNIKK